MIATQTSQANPTAMPPVHLMRTGIFAQHARFVRNAQLTEFRHETAPSTSLGTALFAASVLPSKAVLCDNLESRMASAQTPEQSKMRFISGFGEKAVAYDVVLDVAQTEEITDIAAQSKAEGTLEPSGIGSSTPPSDDVAYEEVETSPPDVSTSTPLVPDLFTGQSPCLFPHRYIITLDQLLFEGKVRDLSPRAPETQVGYDLLFEDTFATKAPSRAARKQPQQGLNEDSLLFGAADMMTRDADAKPLVLSDPVEIEPEAMTGQLIRTAA